MHIFNGLIFSITLVIKLMGSAVKMILLTLGFYLSFLAVLTFLLLFVGANLQSFMAHSEAKTPVVEILPNPKESLDSQIEFWHTQLDKQPTSRDVLMNLSLLYQSKGDVELAKEYREKAGLVDPNYNFNQ